MLVLNLLSAVTRQLHKVVKERTLHCNIYLHEMVNYLRVIVLFINNVFKNCIIINVIRSATGAIIFYPMHFEKKRNSKEIFK